MPLQHLCSLVHSRRIYVCPHPTPHTLVSSLEAKDSPALPIPDQEVLEQTRTNLGHSFADLYLISNFSFQA